MEIKKSNIPEMNRLNNMFIDDKKIINYEMLYKSIDNLTLNPKEKKYLTFKKCNYYIEIYRKNYNFFDIKIKENENDNNEKIKEISNITLSPIKIYYKIDFMYIVNLKQFNNLPKLLNLNDPILFCSKHKEAFEYALGDLIDHLNNQNDQSCFIQVANELHIDKEIEEKTFNSIFKKANTDNIFKNSTYFELNYSDYFNFDEVQNKDETFQFYDDSFNSRQLKIINLCSPEIIIGKMKIYYGQSGMGKSITLIMAFKYNYDHTKFGTLYINCKCIYNLYNNNFKKMKAILKDEIVYLFKNEYSKYRKCLDWIDNYNKEEGSCFWEIIKGIISKFCISEDKQYIFIFDQYKNKLDLNEDIYTINTNLKKNRDKSGIIVCCSMDNKSIRELKIKNFFGEDNSKIKENNIKIKEIKKMFDISKFTIDNGGKYDKTWENIGKTIKNFIILKEFKKYKDYIGLMAYLEHQKLKIYKNLTKFFHLNNDNNVKNSDEYSLFNNLNRILSFSVYTDYTKEYLKQIKNNISFKYFDFKLEVEEKQIKYQIVFKFPLIGEVMTQIYENIIYANKSIYTIFKYIELDPGALGDLYEKYVIYFMQPDKYCHEKNLFNYFKIIKIKYVEKFVRTDNEKYNKKEYVIKELYEGDYLFKQTQFRGKVFDCAIIRINKNNEAIVFFFQISINKIVVYTITELQRFITTFIDYFSFQYKFKIKKENVYFTYIFDFQHKDDLLSKCNQNNLKCIFFVPSIQKFVDKDERELNNLDNIDNIFIKPFLFDSKDGIEMKDETKK